MSDDDLTVLAVKPPPDDEISKIPIHPNLPDINSGAMVLLVSPVKTGKSTLISNLLLNPAFYGPGGDKSKFDIVYIISNTIHNDVTSRYLKEAFPETVFDEYSDDIIRNIIAYQKTFSKKEQPKIAIILDDFVGITKTAAVYWLASRFRHYNIGLLLFATQLFKAVPCVVRQNATHVILGGPNPNENERGKIADEYQALYEGSKNFERLYKEACNRRYNFLYLDLQNNPTRAFRNFDELIFTGHDVGDDAPQ